MTTRALRATWRPWTLAVAVGLIAGDAAALHGLGRRLWCACGSWSPWSWDIHSPHNSEYVIDPYTFTHVLHGVLFYALLWLVFQGRRPALRAVLAVGVEVAWEIAENTETVIRAYRDSTIALGYHGDTIVNSAGDVLAFALGYTGAMLVPAFVSAAAFLVIEAALLLTIRDSLVLNVLMLLRPIEAVKRWQLGG
jgi:uncharacterized protein DUF2585